MSRFAESHAFGEVAPGGYRLNFRRVWNDAKHGPCLCNIASARRHPGIATVRALKRIVEFLHDGLHQSMRGRYVITLQFRPKEGSARTRADRIELQTKAAAATLPMAWQAEFLDFVRKEPGRRSLR